jgi:hypothetical protein
MTACTCSSVAVGFITIIMGLLFSWKSGTWVTADGAALGPGARLPDGGGCGPRRPSA